MSRADREAQARLDGMYYAARRIEEAGGAVPDAFKNELARRGKYSIGIPIPPEELRKYCTDMFHDQYRKMTILTMLVLKDEFDFTTEQLNRFNDRCNRKIIGLVDEDVSYEDYEKILKDENGIELEIDWR